MEIQLKNIAPHPLIGAFSSQTEIWDKELSFKKGDLIHVLAPSGTGKSTLIGILYGTRYDYNGSLTFDSLAVADWSEVRSKKMAVVFQELELLNDLTALENIQLKNQITAHFSDLEIKQMAERLNVEGLLNKRAALLSRGEKQRVAIIRSLCMPFDWILLDEPFSALDKENTELAIELIKEQVARNNAGLILVNLHNDEYFNYSKQLKLV